MRLQAGEQWHERANLDGLGRLIHRSFRRWRGWVAIAAGHQGKKGGGDEG